jgi:hypothetical protein
MKKSGETQRKKINGMAAENIEKSTASGIAGSSSQHQRKPASIGGGYRHRGDALSALAGALAPGVSQRRRIASAKSTLKSGDKQHHVSAISASGVISSAS